MNLVDWPLSIYHLDDRFVQNMPGYLLDGRACLSRLSFSLLTAGAPKYAVDANPTG